MLQKNKAQGGFTLVELMVVVAIIGILSSVAIPSFKKYQAKAKTSEAKLHLASIYSAEVSFFSDSDSYGICLKSMGYDPSGSKDQRYYTTGFESGAKHPAAHDATNEVINGVKCAATTGDGSTFFLAGKKVANHANADTDIKGSNVDDSGSFFVAAAGGRISASDVVAQSPSIFRDMEAYASDGSGNVREDLATEEVNISLWGVNERKEILEVVQGY